MSFFSWMKNTPDLVKDNFTCPVCQDEQWVRLDNGYMTRCNCLKSKIKRSALGEMFQNCSFKTFSPKSKKQEHAKVKVQNTLRKSYFLFGNYGNGKTRIMSCQYADLMDKGYTDLVFLTEYKLYSDWIKRMGDKEFIPTVTVEKLEEADSYHLFLDDVGKLKCSDYYTQEFFGLLDVIYRKKFYLTMTTNYSLQGLEKYFGERGKAIIRRLESICEIVEL